MKNRYALIFVTILSAASSSYAQSEREKVAEGNQLFAEEKYDEANNKYQDALLDNPTSPEIQFNVGNVLYKKNDHEKALESYQKSLDSDDALFQSQSYYNIGNTLYKSGKLPESILAYEQALKLNPDDMDAKYNLEFVRNQIKQNAQPQGQDQQQQQQQDQQQQQEQQQNQEQNEEEQEQEQQQQSEQQEQREMSEEEAKRLLEALKENQEDLKKQQAKAQGQVRVKKDW